MEENKWASSIPLCNMTLGLLILAQAPIMYGIAGPTAIIQIVPWILTAYPVLIIAIIIQFKNGDFVEASANGILSGVLMGQNFVKGIIVLLFVSSGKEIPMEMTIAGAQIDAVAFLVGGIILLFLGWLSHFQSKMGAIGIFAGAIGFLSISIMNFGMGVIFGLIGGICLTILAVYLLYSGLALLLNGATKKTVLPLM